MAVTITLTPEQVSSVLEQDGTNTTLQARINALTAERDGLIVERDGWIAKFNKLVTDINTALGQV